MEALQLLLQETQQERDAAQTLTNQGAAKKRAVTAQALLDLTAAQAAVAAAATGGGAVPFALSPTLALSLLLNYKTEGIKIYGKVTAPLDVLFYGDSGGLHLFLSKVQQRATQFGWTRILVQINQGLQVYTFIENYGVLTIASIRLQAAAIKTANSQDIQKSSQMYTFLITSITNRLLGKLISQREQYTSVSEFLDGPPLLKVLVTISHVNMRAQASHIRQCLARLSITILNPEYNCDIQKLNEYAVVLEEGLAARGEASQDTMMNVQAAYMACKDADFVRFAKDEYAKWEQGATVSLKEYMNSCLIKFKTLKMKGLWETPSPEQEQIIAQTAAVTLLKTRSARDSKSRGTSNKKEVTSLGKTPRKDDGDFAWKGVAPKESEPKSKVLKCKTYHWCTHHTNPLWAFHNPDDAFPNLCCLSPKYAELETAHNKGGKGTEPTVEDITLQGTLAAIENSDSETEE
jgi:hypothetical protein